MTERDSRYFIPAILLLGLLAGCGPKPPALLALSGSSMGTAWHITLVDEGLAIPRTELQEGIRQTLDGVEAAMSTWLPDSELSRFNQGELNTWFPVSPQTAAVVAEAQRISELSGGAFDATVGPLVNLWGFGPAEDPGQMNEPAVPDPGAIREALGRVGYEAIEVRETPPALRRTRPVSLDLSAIAKGYAVDQVADYLLAAGVQRFLVEVGGEVRTAGLRADGTPWRIAVESPQRDQRTIHRVVLLSGQGMATSGDYRNFFASNDQYYSHTIDPTTGWPVDHQLALVSVIDDSTMRADAMATLLMVLGPERGKVFAGEEGLDVLMVHRVISDSGETTLVEYMTPGFEARLQKGEG